MASMKPPSNKMTEEILIDKAVKFGIKKSVASGLLRNNRQNDLVSMINKRIETKTREMEKKSSRMFSNLENVLQKQLSIPNKKQQVIIRRQNVDLKMIKDYFKKEAEKLDKRGPPIPLPKKVLNSAQIAEIEANAQRNMKRTYLDVKEGIDHLPSGKSSNVSVNDEGYKGDSSEGTGSKKLRRSRNRSKKPKRSRSKKPKRSRSKKPKRSRSRRR